MAFASYSDIYDPVVMRKIIGQDWLNQAEIVSITGIVKRDPTPVKGTTVQEIRRTLFQDTTAQALAAGGTVATQAKTETTAKHPVLWRYQGAELPGVIEDIEEKDLPMERASMGEEIREAAKQYIDDIIVNVVKGTGAALTGNQSDQTGAAVTLVDLVDGLAQINEAGTRMQGGAMLMRNQPYFKLLSLGLVAQTANTYGNALQNQMVQSGKLPDNIIGMSAFVSDKFASLGSNQYYIYYVGPNAIALGGNGDLQIKVGDQVALKQWGEVILFRTKISAGFRGVTWGGSVNEQISDTALATAGNWTLAAKNTQNVKLVRVKIQTA